MLFNFDDLNKPNDDDNFDPENYSAEHSLDFEIEDPDTLISRYFDSALSARDEKELYQIFAGFYTAAYKNAGKAILLDEIEDRLNLAQEIDDC